MRDRYPEYPDYDEPLGAARSAGLRRLSRLTWRATQLGALATVGFAAVFARTAPAQTVGSQPLPRPTVHASSPSPSPSPSASPTKAHRRHHHHHRRAAPGTAPGAVPSSPAATLAPPAPPSPAPSPVQTTSSPSHHGGG